MDKNQQKALGLIFILFLLLTYKQLVWDPYFFSPKPGAPAAPVASSGSASSPEAAPAQTQQGAVQGVAPVVTASATGVPSDEELQAKGEVAIENAELLARISLLGGRLTELRVKGYRAELAKTSESLNLIARGNGFPLPLGVYDGQLNDSRVLYQVVAGPANGEVTLEGSFPDGRVLSKRLRLRGYLLDLSTSGVENPQIEWTRYIRPDSELFHDSYNLPAVVWFDGRRTHRTDLPSLPDVGQVTPEPLGETAWISEMDKYFMATLIAPGIGAPGIGAPGIGAPGNGAPGSGALASAFKRENLYITRLAAPELSIFLGPKSYRLLLETGFGLEKSIDFGWLGFLSAPLLSLLHVFFDLLGNYGLAIVALTILVKLLLLPLTASSFKQMKAMQDLQPEVKRIRENVKDKQQQQIELMSLYKKRGVNPLGGCFPILLQLPIFLGLYNALNLAIELRHAPFALWIQDLSAPEKLHLGPVAIPVLVILFVISMILQQWTTPSTMDPVQKKMMLFMPIVFGFLFANFPAGLTLYWLVSNIISIGQTTALRDEKGRSPVLVTTAVSVGLFLLCLLITLIG